MMYLPLDKIMSNNRPTAASGTSVSSMPSSAIGSITDQVIEEIRKRQSNSSGTTRREGRN
jgi:modulator of FtsH protease HflK